ncbi:MAG: hypothetical protein U0871_08475 [Gemmataceae bacterium]
MSRTLPCRFCRTPLDLAQAFAYHVEVATRDNPVMLAAIRRLPHRHGAPLRCCRRCQADIEHVRAELRDTSATSRRVGRAGGQLIFAAVFALGAGVMTARVGRWLAGGGL